MLAPIDAGGQVRGGGETQGEKDRVHSGISTLPFEPLEDSNKEIQEVAQTLRSVQCSKHTDVPIRSTGCDAMPRESIHDLVPRSPCFVVQIEHVRHVGGSGRPRRSRR